MSHEPPHGLSMLHEASADGGLGFCHEVLPALLPEGHHGPLVVALDSNVVIDLQEYGHRLLDGTSLVVEDKHARELSGLAMLLDLWLLRDIRLIVTPRSLTDARKMTPRFLAHRRPTVDALAATLAFQCGDWAVPAPSEYPVPHVGHETGLPDGADRDLVLEAQAVGAHVFLTRDDPVLRRTRLSGPTLAVTSPADLAGQLTAVGTTPFAGGTCELDACPYDRWSMVAPDMGKWSALMSIFEDG